MSSARPGYIMQCHLRSSVAPLYPISRLAFFPHNSIQHSALRTCSYTIELCNKPDLASVTRATYALNDLITTLPRSVTYLNTTCHCLPFGMMVVHTSQEVLGLAHVDSEVWGQIRWDLREPFLHTEVESCFLMTRPIWKLSQAAMCRSFASAALGLWALPPPILNVQ